MLKSRVYFPGLNGLRFFAAIAVVFTHVELMKKFLGHGSHWMDMGEKITTFPFDHIMRKDISWIGPVIASAGPLGVVFFFVLSGFLITYLLLQEKAKLGTIAIRKFYMRRILRIWPLYYLVFFLGFVVLPHFMVFDVPVQRIHSEGNYWENFFLFLFMLPNLAFSIYVAFPNIGQLWSIGVEEQFYLLWPWIIRKSKNVLRALFIFIGAFLFLKLAVLAADHYMGGPVLTVFRKFFAMSKLECMAFGGVGAWLLFEDKKVILDVVYKPVTQWIMYLSIPLLVFFTPVILQNFVHLIYSFIFLGIILNVSSNPDSIIKLRHRYFDFLGNLSYGVYMYHLIVIVFVIHSLDYLFAFGGDLNKWQNLVVYFLSIGLVLGVSGLSYYFFEKRFINLKRKQSVIISGHEAKES